MKNFSLMMFTKETREFLKAYTAIASDNYPECIDVTFIVNAPFVFRTAWAFVKNLIDKRTADKFVILGSDYMPRLLKIMDKEQVPVPLGGSDTSCDGDHFDGGGLRRD